MRTFFAYIALATVPCLIGCDNSGKVTDIPFANVRAAMDQDTQAFKGYFQSIKGQTVRWTGRITEVRRQRGDDFVEEAHMFVDMDEAGRGSPAADVTFQIPISALETRAAGQPVTYVAVLREFERTSDGTLLKMELKSLQ
jgi:hypothetical protein